MSYFNRHFHALLLVLERLARNKLSSLMIVLVIALASAFPALFYLGIEHLGGYTQKLQQETEISVFLALDTSAPRVSQIQASLKANAAIKHIEFVPKDLAWQRMQTKQYGDNVAVQIEKNPLPDAFFIQAQSSSPAALEALQHRLQGLPNVDHVVLNSEWVKRLAALTALAKQVVLFVAFLLGIALILIIGNTIRMQILTQKDEIEVSHLIGATNQFIRTPFLYAGTLYGLFGGMLATAIIALSIVLFNSAAAPFAAHYHSQVNLPPFSLALALVISGTTVLMGWLGAYIAVMRSIASFKIN